MCKKLKQILFTILVLLILPVFLIISAYPDFVDLNFTFELFGQPWTINKDIVVDAIALTALALGLWHIMATRRQIKLFTETEESSMSSISL